MSELGARGQPEVITISHTHKPHGARARVQVYKWYVGVWTWQWGSFEIFLFFQICKLLAGTSRDGGGL